MLLSSSAHDLGPEEVDAEGVGNRVSIGAAGVDVVVVAGGAVVGVVVDPFVDFFVGLVERGAWVLPLIRSDLGPVRG